MFVSDPSALARRSLAGMGAAMTLAVALGLHEGDRPDLAAMHGGGRFRGATMAIGIGVGPAFVAAAVLTVLLLFALWLHRA
jgi:hypothetical protein